MTKSSVVRNLTLLVSAFLLSCHAGSGPLNEQAPSGTVVAQGYFSPGESVTGNVTVYDQGGGNYVVRLSNLSVTSPQAGYQLQADVTSTSDRVTVSGNLISFSGNANYSFNAGQEVGWSVVYIHSPAQETDPGIANMN